MSPDYQSSVAENSCSRQVSLGCDSRFFDDHRCPPRGLLRGSQAITGAANRVQQLMIEALIDFLAQAADMDIDDVGLWIEVIVPDMLQEHRARNHMAGVAHQVFQQAKLAREHLDRLAAPPDIAGQQV